MPRSKQNDQNGNSQGAFGNEKPCAEHDPLTVSGATPGSTPAPGKSKSSDPEEAED
jgi:hypothetical protein